MPETPQITDDLIDIDVCLGIYTELRADWLPIQELREYYNARQELNEPHSAFARFMRANDQEPVQRDYDGRRLMGFYRRQFEAIQSGVKETIHDEAMLRHGHDIEHCAGYFLEWLATIDPDWRMLVEAVQDVRGFDNKTTLASLAGYTLLHRLHMDVPPLDFFSGPSWTPDAQECEICGETYIMAYAGQPCCLNPDCGREYHRRRKEAAQETAA